MLTFRQAVALRNRDYGHPDAPASDYIETESFWWFPPPIPYIGSCGVIIDKADGHIHTLGSALSREEWFYANDLGFKHQTYDFSIDAVHDLDKTLRLLWDIRYTHVRRLAENPPFVRVFTWGCYPYLPRIVEADFFDYHFTVTSCENPKCSAIGSVILSSKR